MKDKFQVSNSSLTRVFCSTNGLLYRGFRLEGKKPNIPAVAGQASHLTFAEWLRGKTIEDCLKPFDAAYEDFAGEHIHDPTDRLTHRNVRLVLQAFLERRAVTGLPFDIVLDTIEKKQGVELGEGFWYEWVRDAGVIEKSTLSPWILDHKTTGSYLGPWYQNDFKMDSQFCGYPWAEEKLTGVAPIGVYINAIKLAKLPDSNKKCKKHSCKYSECSMDHAEFSLFTVTRTPGQLREWEKSAIVKAKRLKQLCETYTEIKHLSLVRKQGMFVYKGCPGCTYQEYCLATMDGMEPERAVEMFLKPQERKK